MVIVRKYGGSCLKSTKSIKFIAKQIARAHKKGEQSVIVVSAMKGATDKLYQQATKVSKSKQLTNLTREIDFLITTGEQVSASLLSIAINDQGIPAKAYTGWQIGIIAKNEFPNGICVTDILHKEKLKTDIRNGVVPIITGFQGIDEKGDILSLGRNSSDLTAVVLAHHLNASECRMYKDVSGIFKCDPKKFKDINVINRIKLSEAISLVKEGAKVTHLEALEYLSKHFVSTRVLHMSEDSLGTELYPDEYPLHESRFFGVAI